jgi:hypothetical protein
MGRDVARESHRDDLQLVLYQDKCAYCIRLHFAWTPPDHVLDKNFDCFPGWTHLNLMTLSRTTNVPAVLSFRPSGTCLPWSAVMDGRADTGRKEDDRKVTRERAALWSRYLSSGGRSTPTNGSLSRVRVPNCPSDPI